MLIDDIRNDMKAAMKAKDAVTLRTLRSVIAAVQEAADRGEASAVELDDAGRREGDRRPGQDAHRGGRGLRRGAAGTSKKPRASGKSSPCSSSYLPEKLTDDELGALVDGVLLADNGFSSMADMGSAMKAVNAEVAGRADGKQVAAMVKARLS